MQRTGAQLAAILAAAAMSAAACASPPAPAPSSTPAAVVSSSPATTSSASTPIPTPTPTVMTMAMAKGAYLGAVCPANAGIDRLNALIAGKTTAGISRNRAKIAAAAKMEVARFRSEYLALTEPKAAWPATLAKDIAVIADSTLGQLDSAQQLADARTTAKIINALNTWKADSPAARKAVQRVRLLTGLPAAGGGKSGCP